MLMVLTEDNTTIASARRCMTCDLEGTTGCIGNCADYAEYTHFQDICNTITVGVMSILLLCLLAITLGIDLLNKHVG